MKKIVFALAILASLQVASAQQLKDAEAAAKKVAAAKAATLNEKKASNAATWLKLGQAYNEAYNAVQGNGYIGASEAELGLLMTGVKTVAPASTVQVQGHIPQGQASGLGIRLPIPGIEGPGGKPECGESRTAGQWEKGEGHFRSSRPDSRQVFDRGR